jgi:hypothetical protein
MWQRIFGPKDPTWDWLPGDGRRLVFDIRHATLDGFPLQTPLSEFKFLGPNEERGSFRRGVVTWFSRGLSFDLADDQTVKTFQVVRADPNDSRFQPFSGDLLYDGTPLDFPRLAFDEIVACAGEPYWIDRDEQEAALFYDQDGRDVRIEIPHESTAARILVTTDSIA